MNETEAGISTNILDSMMLDQRKGHQVFESDTGVVTSESLSHLLSNLSRILDDLRPKKWFNCFMPS